MLMLDDVDVDVVRFFLYLFLCNSFDVCFAFTDWHIHSHSLEKFSSWIVPCAF
jgi:hypothetical protein